MIYTRFYFDHGFNRRAVLLSRMLVSVPVFAQKRCYVLGSHAACRSPVRRPPRMSLSFDLRCDLRFPSTSNLGASARAFCILHIGTILVEQHVTATVAVDLLKYCSR